MISNFIFPQIKVRRRDGKHILFNDLEKKKITLIRERFHVNVIESSKTETVHELDDNGNLSLSLDIAENELSFSLKVVKHTISHHEILNILFFFLLSDDLFSTRN